MATLCERDRLSRRRVVERALTLVALLASGAVAYGSHGGQGVGGNRAAHQSQPARPITPVVGSSTLHQLALTIQESSMGSTGMLGPRPDVVNAASDYRPLLGDLTQPVTITGEDLYRLDCRGCHKVDGGGAPPEINTLIEPVQGTSLVLWQQRMKAAGRSVDAAFAASVVSGAKADLLKRLREGGKKMPAPTHLQGPEVEALVAYLEVLAGVPGASARQRTVTVTWARVGEHVVKGTCHTCHDARGSWPTPEALLDNAIPSLASLTLQRTLAEVVHKVRVGSPIVMGIAHVPYRGRMPVFDYLTDTEAAAAYMYLLMYPPN
jgi:mono/diheme cytochrome c family protein